MKELSLSDLAKVFTSAGPHIHTALEAGLEVVARTIEEEAKEEIGVYQPAVGPFDAWAPLAESTKADRVRQGYSEDDPLLRSGELRDSISHRVMGLAAVVGSTDDKAVWQEYGTDRIPPRPFIGPAYVKSFHIITEMVGFAVTRGFRVK
ncbi:TPA: phage virion morphogenesis protein [Enterobacter ludwigii]|nr:phage virion morphogenesis protein [Enterobacter ludwigii]HDR2600114.1 phage virion morphogenesis protein [Enterobacter ludwigii]